jgi:hypothetical protein
MFGLYIIYEHLNLRSHLSEAFCLVRSTQYEMKLTSEIIFRIFFISDQRDVNLQNILY